MKQQRRGTIVGQNLSDADIKKRVLSEVGQGDWKITHNASGSLIYWLAEKELPRQGPQGLV